MLSCLAYCLQNGLVNLMNTIGIHEYLSGEQGSRFGPAKMEEWSNGVVLKRLVRIEISIIRLMLSNWKVDLDDCAALYPAIAKNASMTGQSIQVGEIYHSNQLIV